MSLKNNIFAQVLGKLKQRESNLLRRLAYLLKKYDEYDVNSLYNIDLT